MWKTITYDCNHQRMTINQILSCVREQYSKKCQNINLLCNSDQVKCLLKAFATAHERLGKKLGINFTELIDILIDNWDYSVFEDENQIKRLLNTLTHIQFIEFRYANFTYEIKELGYFYLSNYYIN